MEILPILVEPARWKKLDLHGLFQMVPGDPTPISGYIERGQHAWKQVRLEVLDTLEKTVDRVRADDQTTAANPPEPVPEPVPDPTSDAALTKDPKIGANTEGPTPTKPRKSSLPELASNDLQVVFSKGSPCGQILFGSPHLDHVVMSHGFGWKGLVGIWDPSELRPVGPMYYSGLGNVSIPFFQVGFRDQQVFYATGWNSFRLKIHAVDLEVEPGSFLAVSPSALLRFNTQKGGLGTTPIQHLTEVVREFETDGCIRSLALSPDVRFAAACMDGRSTIYSCDSGSTLTTIEEDAPSRSFQDFYARFSPGGRFFGYITPKQDVHHSGATSVILLDTASWSETGRFADPDFRHEIKSFAFSTDEKLLATVDTKPQILIWDLRSESLIRKFETPEGFGPSHYEAVTFTANDQAVVAAGNGLEFWDLELDTLRYRVDYHKNDFVLRPDATGRFLASAGGQETISVQSGLKKQSVPEFEAEFPGRLKEMGFLLTKEDFGR